MATQQLGGGGEEDKGGFSSNRGMFDTEVGLGGVCFMVFYAQPSGGFSCRLFRGAWALARFWPGLDSSSP